MNYLGIVREISNKDFSVCDRRLIKLMEEMGEVSEAFLNITSLNNSKNKSWEDVREELVDCFIVGLDIFTIMSAKYTQDTLNIENYPIVSLDQKSFTTEIIDLFCLANSMYIDIEAPENIFVVIEKYLSHCMKMALTRFPDIINETDDQINQRFNDMFIKKTSKWKESLKLN